MPTAIIHLRRARPADARAIAQVHVQTWRDAYADLLPAEFLAGLDVQQREGHWRAELMVRSSERAPWLAHADDQVVGFASVGPSRDRGAAASTGELYAIYVLPDFWDRGVGTDLLRRAEHDLVAHGYADATLWVLAGNERARRFYERAGWHLDGERLDRIGDIEVEEVRYRRTLEPPRLG
ncbi:MAG TPA: GNAT family N-acetyltransferase [Candidatus Limnocylindrales bacterium]|nr:GNAT family N-acetyltransferase [Candidatus Limnocylindrales bacterium]